MTKTMGTEQDIVFENNHKCCCSDNPFPPSPRCPYGPDPINVYTATGKHVGYTWNYGDSIELVIYMENTVLRVRDDQMDDLERYLSDKEIEVNFTNMRGEVKYTFYVPASLRTKIKLNADADTLIEKNTYSLSLVLINPMDLSRINLLMEPYKVYVK